MPKFIITVEDCEVQPDRAQTTVVLEPYEIDAIDLEHALRQTALRLGLGESKRPVKRQSKHLRRTIDIKSRA